MHKQLKPIPHFRTEAEERAFWETHDSADYVDWSQAVRARFPNLRPTPQRPPVADADAAARAVAAD